MTSRHARARRSLVIALGAILGLLLVFAAQLAPSEAEQASAGASALVSPDPAGFDADELEAVLWEVGQRPSERIDVPLAVPEAPLSRRDVREIFRPPIA